MKNIEIASVLAFEKKICNSDALMFSGMWDSMNNPIWNPIPLQEKGVKGTISNRPKGGEKNDPNSDPIKMDAEAHKANLQRVDVACLPFDADTLKVVFTLRILGNIAKPAACDKEDYQKALEEKLNAYFKNENSKELAIRYAENIANGRFLWRNRVGAESVVIKVHYEGLEGDKTWVFDALKFNLNQFSGKSNPDIVDLGNLIHKGLTENTKPFFRIEAFVKVGVGQEVYPSQELVLDLDESKNKKINEAKKSKYLYAVNKVAAMHSQKIGNALRTIDTWYSRANDFGPISVEPYGTVTNRAIALRPPKEKKDFYTLLDDWIPTDKILSAEDQHFVVACLIRGGVFGKAKSKPSTTADESQNPKGSSSKQRK